MPVVDDLNKAHKERLARMSGPPADSLAKGLERMVAEIENLKVRLAAVEVAAIESLRWETPPTDNTPAINDIKRAVCQHFELSEQELISKRRDLIAVRARQIVIYLCRTYTPRSLPEVGRRLGARDHTTILHSYQKSMDTMGSDQELVICIDLVKQALLDSGFTLDEKYASKWPLRSPEKAAEEKKDDDPKEGA